MTISPEVSFDGLRALFASAPADSKGLEPLLEQWLRHLITSDPRSAREVGYALSSQGGSARDLGRAVLQSVGTLELAPAAQETLEAARVVVDYLVVTIKQEELNATLDAFDVEPTQRQYLVRGVEIYTCARDGITYGIVMAGRAGNVTSAAMIGSLIPLISFKGAVLVGMAAGNPSKKTQKIGDVVVSEMVVDYEFQRLTTEGSKLTPQPYHPPHDGVFRNAEGIETHVRGWGRKVQAELASRSYGAHEEDLSQESRQKLQLIEPTVKLGVIMAGGKLIEDGSLAGLAAHISDRVRAAEMDGAGLAAACKEWGIPWVVVRGIADVGEADRPKEFQYAAAYAAAAFVRDGLPCDRIVLDPKKLGMAK